MLPASLLSCRRADGTVAPDYLGPADYPWLRALIDEYRRFEGKTFRELGQRLAEPLSPEGPRHRKARASAVLDRLFRDRNPPATGARAARRALFGAAGAQPHDPPGALVAAVARDLGVSIEELERALFADLPGERRVVRPLEPLGPVELALETNMALAKGVVNRATGVTVELSGNARQVIGLARLKGLICVIDRHSRRGADLSMSISGPLALFRKTVVYGRALASLLGVLTWCDRFRLVARCSIAGEVASVEIGGGDPLPRSKPPRRFDSAVENRFFEDFSRVAPDWQLIREPEPLETPESVIFPDFALEHRRDPGRRWVLEIVGFWTRDYLERKLAALSAVGISNLIVCVDSARNCDARTLPDAAAVIAYKRWIDPEEVLAVIE